MILGMGLARLAGTGVYSRVDSHPPGAIFSDDVYLDSAWGRWSRERAIYRDRLASMDEFVPDGNEIGCIGR